MSIRIMTQVWDTELPDSLKIVLLALADCADDDGRCWPSIATLQRKTSKKSARTVQMAIARLVEDGHMSRREVPGRGCIYAIHPRNDCRGANSAGVHSVRGTPATAAGDPRNDCTQTVKNHQEPSMGGARGRAPAPAPDFEKGDESKGGKVLPHRLPDDWQVPPIEELSPLARQLVAQWPAGAYQAMAEAFRLHWMAEQGTRARKVNWTAALGKWLIEDHRKVMRDLGKVSYPAPAAAPGAAAAAPARQALVDTPAKRRESGPSFTLHTALARLVGAKAHDTWLAPCALLVVDDAGVKVVASSEFHRDRVEAHFAPAIRQAAREVLGHPAWVAFEVQRPQLATSEGARAHG